MSLKRIESVAKPKVGKFYLVPAYHRRDRDLLGWWPVIGPWHEDSDLGVSEFHFHFDVRFMTNRQLGTFLFLGNEVERQNNIHRALARVATNKDCLAAEQPMDIQWVKKKMKREMPEFAAKLNGALSHICTKLETEFRNVKMKCMTCPHRGMNLKDGHRKGDTVVCHGHGLKWNVKTGEMIPRIIENETDYVW